MRARGDPPFHAGVAQQRQQQFRKLPGDSPHGSASLPVGPISCSRSSNYQSGRLRTARLQVRFLPGVPFQLGMWFNPNSKRVQLQNLAALGVQVPSCATNFTAPGLRGNSRPQRLKIAEPSGASPTGAPTGVWLTGNSRPVRLKPEQPWECKSPHADHFWNANRASEPGLVLTVRAFGQVAQVHGIPPFHARVAQREPAAL